MICNADQLKSHQPHPVGGNFLNDMTSEKAMAKIVAFACAALFSASGLLANCRASIVFDNGDNVDVGRLASHHNRAADNFSLLTTTTITDVHWKGFYAENDAAGTDDFTINIYADNGAGLPTPPTTAIYSTNVGAPTRIVSGEVLFDFYIVYEYSTFIAPFEAEGGVNYWIEVFNNATQAGWSWTFSPGGNGVSTEGSDNWENVQNEHAFQLTNDAVPEASALAIWAVISALGLVVGKKIRMAG